LIADISIAPLGEGTSVSKYVARAVAIIRESGLKHEFHSMGTNVEGSYDQIVKLVKKCSDAVFAMGAERVIIRMYMDDRHDRTATIQGKKRSVESRLK
jgi:uncharacterized protein (TIGR00106 family)